MDAVITPFGESEMFVYTFYRHFTKHLTFVFRIALFDGIVSATGYGKHRLWIGKRGGRHTLKISFDLNFVNKFHVHLPLCK